MDAKAPLDSYLDAIEAHEEHVRESYLKQHCRQSRNHMTKLGSKAYWQLLQAAPEFVAMVLPGEIFFSSALEQDSTLIEDRVAQRVIPASPTTIIALLIAVTYGWRRDIIAQSAEEVNELGKELYERIRVLADHMDNLGQRLDSVVAAYNKNVGSFET